MKTKTILLKSFMILSLIVLASCSTDNEGNDNLVAPNLPPEASMVMDFNTFNGQASKSTENKFTLPPDKSNWLYSSVVVGVWHTALVTTLAVPVASFQTAFRHKAEYKGNAVWEWKYTVDGFTSQYAARLTGELVGNEVLWKMYITKSGIDAFDEFMWFSGTSKVDGKSGHWMLNHSAAYPENMLRIDWAVEGEEIGNIKYTYVRELNNERETDTFKNSAITYGLQAGDYDAFYDVYVYDNNSKNFVSADMEWHRTNHNGRVKAEYHFGDTDWHCWDNKGENVVCP
ncbi:hypothetical protein [Algibacter sp. 2305UL17-15]|uniref:hypothetical protein n=1 Tax=Algibacter sp. 2305UL17-15 TaxID=3231268 RepID=UPI0034588985